MLLNSYHGLKDILSLELICFDVVVTYILQIIQTIPT